MEARVWATPVVASAYSSVAGSDGSIEYPSSADEGPSVPRASGKARNRTRSRGASGSASGNLTSAGKPMKAVHQPGQPATTPSTGRVFCQAFNNGGCVKIVECKTEGHLHAYNFVDSSGRLCGLTGHRRMNHADYAKTS